MYQRLSLVFIVVGLVLRFWHFLRCPSVWHDEAALIVNVIDLDYRQLLGPLLHHEAGPPLFLWIEHFMVEMFGDNIWSLRFPSFLVSCLSLVLFWDLARRTLSERAVPWAVFLFALSDRLLWHATEAKPYAFDVFVAVLLAQGFLRTRNWAITPQCLFWIPILPICIWLSYPACFLSGGIILGVFLRSFDPSQKIHLLKLLRQPGLWLLVLAVGVSFLALALGPAKAQRDGAMESCWTNHFPNWSKPWRFIDWTIFSTFEVIRYNVVTLGIGQAFVVLLAVGAYHTWKTRSEKIWLVVLLSPMLLVYLASCLHKYPFGGSRVEVFLAPALMWVIAAAIPPAYDWLKNRGRYQPLVLAVLLCAPVLQTGFRAAVDWPRADCATASDYVLNHCETHEALLINHWEFEYYLRNASSKPIYLENLKDHPEQCWVLIVGDKSEEREHDISTWIKNALVLEKKEFFRAIVLRVRFESGAVSAPLSAD